MKTIPIVAILLLASCSFNNPCGQDKDQFLYNFHKFVKDIEDQELPYNDDHWEDLDVEFRKYTKECFPKYREELTRADKEEYYENTMTYYITKYGEGLANQYADDGEILFEQIGERIEEWMDTEGRDIERKVEEWLDTEGRDIEREMKEWFETEGKELGRQIEDAFENFEENFDKEKVEEALNKLGEILQNIEININSDEKEI